MVVVILQKNLTTLFVWVCVCFFGFRLLFVYHLPREDWQELFLHILVMTIEKSTVSTFVIAIHNNCQWFSNMTQSKRLSYLPPKCKVSDAMLHLIKFVTIQPYSPDLFLEAFSMRYAQVLVSFRSEVMRPHSLIWWFLKNNCTRYGCSENLCESPSLDLFPMQTIVRS